MADESKTTVGQRKSVSLGDVKHPRSLSTTSRMNQRRQSFGFRGVPGVRPIERSSQIALEFKRPPLIFLPTYQLNSFKKFKPSQVMKIIDEELDNLWTGHKYNPVDSPSLAMNLAGEIMRKVKGLNYNRYRILSIVTIGQKRAQSYHNAVSMIWDYERDSYADTHRECVTNFVQVTVFGIYLD